MDVSKNVMSPDPDHFGLKRTTSILLGALTTILDTSIRPISLTDHKHYRFVVYNQTVKLPL